MFTRSRAAAELVTAYSNLTLTEIAERFSIGVARPFSAGIDPIEEAAAFADARKADVLVLKLAHALARLDAQRDHAAEQ